MRRNVGGAVDAVTEHPDAVYLAGGTNLVDRMKLEIATPNLVVDISHLPLDQIVELPDGTVRIGAMWAITGGVALTGKGALNLREALINAAMRPFAA